MTDQPTATDQTDRIDQPDRTTIRTEEIDTQWITLQRVVAAAMIVTVSAPMVLVVGDIIPPLLIAGVLFAGGLALTWSRPRAGTIAVGVLTGVWMLLVLANPVLATDDLARPSMTVFFMMSLGMIVLPVVGLVGLVGVLRRASGRIAVRTLQALGIVLLGGLVLSVLAGVL